MKQSLSNPTIGAVIGMLISLPRYAWSARVLVSLLAFFSSVFIFRVFLYDGNLFQAFVEGNGYYPAAVVTMVFCTYAYNKWIINPGITTNDTLEE